MAPAAPAGHARPWRPHARFGGLALALLLVLVLASSATLQRLLVGGIEQPAELLAAHPRTGALVFVALAASSAMLSFFSSVPLVPFAVAAWGAPAACTALFAGWMLGAGASYWLGASLHHRVERLRLYRQVAELRDRLRHRHREFSVVLLFRLAMPAEIPGYVLGMLRYPFGRYLLATALAELPMALGTVYAGRLLIESRPWALAALIVAGALLLALFHHLFDRRMRRPPAP